LLLPESIINVVKPSSFLLDTLEGIVSQYIHVNRYFFQNKYNIHIYYPFIMDSKIIRPILFALASAVLFGISAPLAKILLNEVDAVVLAGLLYLGAFVGLGLYSIVSKIFRTKKSDIAESLGKKDLPYLAGAVIFGGIIGPIALMVGLSFVSGFVASLLLNMEVVATVLIALIIFKENSGPRLWIALLVITLGGVLLTWNPAFGNYHIIGSILIIIAMISWGIDNNLTRQISDKSPVQITLIKGIIGGSASISLALAIGAKITLGPYLLYGLILGTISVGLSLIFFINALQGLGSSRTGMIFSIAPFIGAGLSIFLLRDQLYWYMLPATLLMIIGVFLLVKEDHSHKHRHEEIQHTHRHIHDGLHHKHVHSDGYKGWHSHPHTHKPIFHIHIHWPDIHHRHDH
jgi:drug/metabolite transporter (DMT)-like permease